MDKPLPPPLPPSLPPLKSAGVVAPLKSGKVMGSPIGQRQRPLPLIGNVVTSPFPLEPLPVGKHADAVPVSEAAIPPANSPPVGRESHRLVGRSDGRSVSQSVFPSVGQFHSRSFGRFRDRDVGRSADQSIEDSADRSIGRSVGWKLRPTGS